MKPLRIGLAGCGRAAERIYLPVLSKMNTEFCIVAAADPLQERRDLFRSAIPDCMVFPSVIDLIEGSDIDTVIITTPPETHLEIADLSLRSGLHVFIEKPLSVSLSGLDELKSLSKSVSGKVMVGFNRRYWKAIKDLHDVIERNRGQNIGFARLVMRSDVKLWSPISGKSHLLDDLGSHQVDMILYIFGREILSVCAEKTDIESIDMKITLDNGIMVNCLLSYGDRSYESVNINIGGKRFQIMTGSDRITPAQGFARSVLDLSDMVIRRISLSKSSFRNSYGEELKNFHNCISAGIDPIPGINDGIASVRVLDAAKKSLDSNGEEIQIIS